MLQIMYNLRTKTSKQRKASASQSYSVLKANMRAVNYGEYELAPVLELTWCLLPVREKNARVSDEGRWN